MKNAITVFNRVSAYSSAMAALPHVARFVPRMGFKPYLLEEKMGSVAELFLNRYALLATKASIQLRIIESIDAFVPGSIALARGVRRRRLRRQS